VVERGPRTQAHSSLADRRGFCCRFSGDPSISGRQRTVEPCSNHVAVVAGLTPGRSESRIAERRVPHEQHSHRPESRFAAASRGGRHVPIHATNQPEPGSLLRSWRRSNRRPNGPASRWPKWFRDTVLREARQRPDGPFEQILAEISASSAHVQEMKLEQKQGVGRHAAAGDCAEAGARRRLWLGPLVKKAGA